jgi:hypothetical protein
MSVLVAVRESGKVDTEIKPQIKRRHIPVRENGVVHEGYTGDGSVRVEIEYRINKEHACG